MGFNLKLPANTGHEVCGVIEEVGRDVRAAKVGDRVTIPFHDSDGTCPECRSGHQNLCDHVIVPGVQRLGGWAQYVTVGAADLNCIRLPESVSSLSAAALGCATAPRNTPDRDRRRPSHCSREPRSSGFVVRTMKVCVRGTSRTKPKNSAKMRVCGRPAGGGELVSKNVYGEDSPLGRA